MTARMTAKTRRQLVRLELTALAVIGSLLLYRVWAGPPRPEGFIVFTDLEPNALRQAAFRLDRPTRFAVDATGSYSRTGSDGSELAAYGWIVQSGEAEAAWSMASAAPRGQGTLARVRDTLMLPAGRYDVYFASYGATASRGGGSLLAWLFDAERPWLSDRSKWSLVLRPLGEAGGAERLRGERPDAVDEGVFWQAAPVGSGETRTQLVEVKRPVDVWIEATGEIGRERADYGTLERLPGGEVVWEMTAENTQLAGGADVNRRYEGVISLRPGLYRATFQTDGSHAYADWRGNPPFDPNAWGMMLMPTTPAGLAAAAPFDPWTSRAPLVALDSVRDDALVRAQFVVGRPLSVVAQAVGEFTNGNAHDYAWIEDAAGEPVWTMRYAASEPAGGARKNRRETAVLALDPGLYTLAYQTDGSHAYGRFNADAPDHPERWGVALFPLEATSLDSAAFRVLQISRSEGDPLDEAPAPPLGTGERLLEATRLQDNADVRSAFTLEEPARLRIRATGEISIAGRRYDYGWIERLPDGETVWEMTLQNTRPAGGHDKNRRFDGTITLPPGRYAVRFKTDFTHAYGSFNRNGSPDDPDAWGIVVERASEATER